jgi:hypothetical protein
MTPVAAAGLATLALSTAGLASLWAVAVAARPRLKRCATGLLFLLCGLLSAVAALGVAAGIAAWSMVLILGTGLVVVLAGAYPQAVTICGALMAGAGALLVGAAMLI